MANGKSLVLKIAYFGAGFAAMLVAMIAGWQVFQSMPETPKPWNDDAIKATFVELSVTTGERLVTTFKYSIQNTTPHDYYLPSDPNAAFVILPKEGGLSQHQELNWNKGAYIPAGQKMSVWFQLSYDYNDSFTKSDRDKLDKLSNFMDRRLKEVDGFVVLDRDNRYRVVFPKGWQEATSKSR